MKKSVYESFVPAALQVARTVQAIKSKKMADYDLKGTNATCLCRILLSEDGLTATQLAAACKIDKAQVSRAMTDLVKRRLVTRDDMNGHRYKQKYYLTDAGVVAATDITETTRNAHKILYRGVDEKDRKVFEDVLAQMLANLDALAQDKQ